MTPCSSVRGYQRLELYDGITHTTTVRIFTTMKISYTPFYVVFSFFLFRGSLARAVIIRSFRVETESAY